MKSTVVADIVKATIQGASDAIIEHLSGLVEKADGGTAPLADALDFGYDADLEDIISTEQLIGFDHLKATAAFRTQFDRYGLLDRLGFIGAADSERGLFALATSIPE